MLVMPAIENSEHIRKQVLKTVNVTLPRVHNKVSEEIEPIVETGLDYPKIEADNHHCAICNKDCGIPIRKTALDIFIRIFVPLANHCCKEHLNEKGILDSTASSKIQVSQIKVRLDKDGVDVLMDHYLSMTDEQIIQFESIKEIV